MTRHGGTPGPSRATSAQDSRGRIVLTRRAVCVGAAAIGGGSRAEAGAAAMPGSPTILVAGPPGGRVDRWANLIAEPLGRSMLQAAAVGHENIGGPDGVTGANHFQASTTPDGATALIMPGATTLSWLVGDPRVRFDAGSWVPLWGGTMSSIAVSRVALVRGGRVRVAVQSIVGPELAALLTLELMGVDAIPVAVEPAAGSPLDRPDIDLVLLRGPSLRKNRPELAARRWGPAFGLGVVGADGRLGRDPAFPEMPIAHELIEQGGVDRARELSAALRPVACASALDVGLVLPLLSPAAVVAWWRHGCTALATATDVQEEATRSLVRPIQAGPMAASVAILMAEPAVLLELRRWLADRHHWRPS